MSKSVCFSDLGFPSVTVLFLESSQVRQISLVGNLVSPVRVYASPEVVAETVSPSVASPLSLSSSATEEAQAKTDRISSLYGLIKRGLLGPRVVSPSPIVVKEASSSS